MRAFDVVVVGAGPGGSFLATLAARRGLSVLLAEQARFPRAKVCGGCLNPNAVALLTRHGLDGLLADAGAVPLRSVTLFARGHSVTLPFGGVAVGRDRLDTEFANRAADAGATVETGTTAKLLPQTSPDWRELALTTAGASETVRAGVVVAADGLLGGLVRDEAGPTRVAHGSRIGAGVVLESSPGWCPPGRLAMLVGRGGYVGLTRLDGNRLDVAAALDPAAVRESGLALAAGAVINENGLTLPSLATAAWRGTPALTRTPGTVAGARWFRLGDAAGYVEPFTGEGMTWALRAAHDLAPLASQEWSVAARDAWRRHAPSRRLCRAVAQAVRSPRLTAWAIALMKLTPGPALAVVRRFGRSPSPVRSEFV